jgi:hypothetical protein
MGVSWRLIAPSWLGVERVIPACAHLAAHVSTQSGRGLLLIGLTWARPFGNQADNNRITQNAVFYNLRLRPMRVNLELQGVCLPDY